MSEFKFAPANGWDRLDSKTGKCTAMWTLEDVQKAMYAHAKCFSPTRTLSILHEITGIKPNPKAASHQGLSPRFFGPIISRLCDEVTTRPNKVHANV